VLHLSQKKDERWYVQLVLLHHQQGEHPHRGEKSEMHQLHVFTAYKIDEFAPFFLYLVQLMYFIIKQQTNDDERGK
jgi:hypothetical protein